MFAENVKYNPGNKAPVSGVYRSEKEYIPLTRGERFPPAMDGKWTLVVNLSSFSVKEALDKDKK